MKILFPGYLECCDFLAHGSTLTVVTLTVVTLWSRRTESEFQASLLKHNNVSASSNNTDGKQRRFSPSESFFIFPVSSGNMTWHPSWSWECPISL